MTKIEKGIINYIEKHVLEFFLIVVSILACVIRLKLFEFYSGDFLQFLIKWLNYFKNNGHLHGLASYPGDYNAPYMTILALISYLNFSTLFSVKIISVIFDFLLALFSGKLVHELTKEKNKYFEYITYSIVLFLPTVIFNSALWAQCDSIYVTFVILSLLFLVKKKYKSAFIALGVSFAFKLQFIFILPLYVVLYFREKKFSIFNFLFIPLVNFILCLPAIFYGKPLLECLLIYFNQTTENANDLTLNLFNFYEIFTADEFSNLLYTFGILFVLFICGFVLFYCIYKKIKFDNRKIMFLGLWFILIVTYFLPGMHERYLYMGEIIAVILLITYKKPVWLTFYIFFLAMINYCSFLFEGFRPFPCLLSAVYFALLVKYTISTFKELNDITE